MLAEGAKAPDFSLGDWTLSEALKKGPVLLAFYKVSCPTCQLTLPFIQRLADGAAPGAPAIVTISQDDAATTAQFEQRFQISLSPKIDAPSYRASNLYGLRNVPTLYLVEPSGVISLAVSGFSKAHLEKLGARFGAAVFRPGENVPEFRPG